MSGTRPADCFKCHSLEYFLARSLPLFWLLASAASGAVVPALRFAACLLQTREGTPAAGLSGSAPDAHARG